MSSIFPSILLIDDNEHGLVARQAVLEERGYRVRTALCGQEGLSLFESGDFDLVVTDYLMPGLDGREVIAGIRERRPSTPVVVLSGFAAKLGLNETETGADAVLHKGPSELDDLLRTVARLMRRRMGRERGKAKRSRSA